MQKLLGNACFLLSLAPAWVAAQILFNPVNPYHPYGVASPLGILVLALSASATVMAWLAGALSLRQAPPRIWRTVAWLCFALVLGSLAQNIIQYPFSASTVVVLSLVSSAPLLAAGVLAFLLSLRATQGMLITLAAVLTLHGVFTLLVALPALAFMLTSHWGNRSLAALFSSATAAGWVLASVAAWQAVRRAPAASMPPPPPYTVAPASADRP